MRSPNILVAEDHPINQLVIRRMLECLGCEVNIVANGLEAVAAAGARQFDLILMDLQMPEMDGLQATRMILSMSALKPVIIACTAHVSPEHRAECRDAGMDDFLGKPVQKEELEVLLGRWLEVARERQEKSEGIGYAGRLAHLVAETDDAFVRKLAAMFMESGRELVTTVVTEWHRGHQDTAIKAIHALRGAAGHMGADELMRACAAWEREGDEGVLEEDDLRQLELLFEQTVIALADALRSLPMPGTPEIPHPAGAAQE